MSGNNIIPAGRTLEQVTQGIRILSAQTAANICQIGKLLTEAKAMVGHGEWGKYLEEQVAYSQSTANNFMRLYNEYGEFGPNCQTFGNLSAGQALELLKLPAAEREAFAEEHDVESMSVRQLRAEIAAEKKRADEAVTDTAALREQLLVATEEIGAATQRAADWQKQAHDWQGKASKEMAAAKQLRGDIRTLEQDLALANAKAGRVSPEELARINDEALENAIRTVADSHRQELAGKDARIAELEAQLAAAQSAQEQSAEQQAVVELIKEAATAVGEDLNRLQGYYLKFTDNAQLAGAIRSLVSRQIYLMYDKFDIEPV